MLKLIKLGKVKIMFCPLLRVVLETLNDLNGIHFSPQPILKIIII